MTIKISETFPSKYLKAQDIGSRSVVWKMTEVEMADLQDGDTKPIVYFEGTQKGLVLNKTNATVLADAFGDDTAGWSGKEVELFTMPVTFQGQTRPAIRVKTPAKNALGPNDDIPQ